MTNKKIVKALSKLNDYIDDDRQKLCDRIKLLEKSHRRMFRLLVNIDVLANQEYFNGEIGYHIWENQFIAVLDAIHNEIERKVL